MPGKQRAKPRLTRREKKAQTSILVQIANEAINIMSELQEWTTFTKHNLSLKIEYASSDKVEPSVINEIFALLKTNMQLLYEKSDWGWNEAEKKEELADKNAKYLLARDPDGKLVGFSHFRFDVEVNHPILYCYELQIDEQIQRKGVGKHLMNILFLIAYQFKLVKIVLTVFKHNTAGINFYMKSLAFRHDETCPKDEEGECYVILSKFVDQCEVKNIKNSLNII